MSSNCLSESEKGLLAAGPHWGKFAANGTEGCSPTLDLTSNSTADLSSSRNNETPRRKLSMCSTSSSPGVLAVSDKRHQTPDSHGLKFRGLNFSTEDSPYLQYKTGYCFVKDCDSQQNNESSPTKRTRSKRCREPASPNRLEESRAVKVERIRAVETCFSDLRHIPGCSPLPPSPVENDRLDAAPEVMLHFDRKLVRTVLTAPANKVSPDSLPEEPTSISNESHFTFSSTPVHSQISGTFPPFSIPLHLSEASPGVSGSACGRLLFTPERPAPSKNPAGGSVFNRNDPAVEHARRNLFHVPKLSYEANSPFKDATSDTSDSSDGDAVFKTHTPSSGYVSMTSTGSLLSSSDSPECVPVSVAEKMDFAEGKEFFEGEGVTVESLVLVSDRMKAVDCESEDLTDVDGVGEEDVALQGLCSGDEQTSLIGDFSRPYALPLVRSRNQDLKAISPDTLADIVAGHYDDVIDFYQIIDCRYPYEFSGGHIKGAKNIYEAEDLVREFFTDSTLLSHFEPTKRSILIFHCEFSSERAPKLLRFLRKNDRDVNTYPFLCYPEAYILDGGYKAFFHSHPQLCQPASYVPMLHSDYSDDLKKFRTKSRLYQDEYGKRLLRKRFATANY